MKVKNFFGSIFINRDELREAGIDYPIKVEYYKIINEEEKIKQNKLIYGIQIIKTEYKDKIGVEQEKIEHITNDENEISRILSIMKENEVTLIISDWMMPNMNGIELCKTIRSNPLTSHIPFILLTAKTDNSSKIEGMDCGADAYIEKPFSIHYLDACMTNLIEMRILLHKKFSQTPLMPLNSIANNTVDDQFLRHMNQLIEENFSNPNLSVDFLAERLCISRSGLFAKIKTLTNVTPNELIQVVRLKKAASLLLENKYRVSEICYMIGFNNPSYFSKCFQKQFGMKPGEFAISGGNKQMEE